MKKLYVFVTCLLISFVATACANNVSDNVTAIPLPTDIPVEESLLATAGSFFALSVSDINASAEWYSEKLGLEITMQLPNTNQPTVIVLEGDRLIVELIKQENAIPLREVTPAIADQSLIHGIFKVGIVVQDFDKALEVLKERNVTIAFGPFLATAEQRANVIIVDNEGNLIQIFGK